MGVPTGCVRRPRASFSIVSFWAKCSKCKHLFIAHEMVACVGGRGDNCPRCSSKKYKYLRSLTHEEKVKLERDVREFQDKILRKRLLLRKTHPRLPIKK